MSRTKNWEIYGECPSCEVPAGEQCINLQNGKPIGGAHPTRKDAPGRRRGRIRDNTARCKDCKEFLPLENFPKSRNHWSGVGSRCRRCMSGYMYQRRYGITVDQYEALLAEQGGVCAICGDEPKERQLSVDHCHKTGRVRGLLCTPCNVGLGHLEKPGWAKKAVAYVKEHRGRD